VTAFRVTIDGRAYEGDYGDKADAVYGCMRKDDIDRSRAVTASMPHINMDEHRTGSLFRVPREEIEARPEWKAFRERQQQLVAENHAPSVVTIERVVGRKVTKKVHRVLGFHPATGP
jgi:hypothetical protein